VTWCPLRRSRCKYASDGAQIGECIKDLTFLGGYLLHLDLYVTLMGLNMYIYKYNMLYILYIYSIYKYLYIHVLSWSKDGQWSGRVPFA
jgi:hypothetical protein